MLRLPCRRDWLKTYSVETLGSDLVAAVIVTIMLIPQSLAYALLAGLPLKWPTASIAAGGLCPAGQQSHPLGGPRGSCLHHDSHSRGQRHPGTAGRLRDRGHHPGTAERHAADPAGPHSFRICSQSAIPPGGIRLHHLLGNPDRPESVWAHFGYTAEGDTLPSLLSSLLASLETTNLYTLAIGAFALLFLQLCRTRLAGALSALGMARSTAELMTKAAPVMAVALTILLAALGNFESKGVALVGAIPQGLPAFSAPNLSLAVLGELLVPALLIALIGFVESVSVGRTLGGKRGERIDPNQELIGLGAANIAAGVSGGFPVTGGFSRSVVNFDAGARTQAASIMTAGGIALAAASPPRCTSCPRQPWPQRSSSPSAVCWTGRPSGKLKMIKR